MITAKNVTVTYPDGWPRVVCYKRQTFKCERCGIEYHRDGITITAFREYIRHEFGATRTYCKECAKIVRIERTKSYYATNKVQQFRKHLYKYSCEECGQSVRQKGDRKGFETDLRRQGWQIGKHSLCPTHSGKKAVE